MMRIRRGLVPAGLLAGAALALAGSAQAAPVTINDQAGEPAGSGTAYWGANPPGTGANDYQDLVANNETTSSPFEIKQGVVNVTFGSGQTPTTLTLDIYTNYAPSVFAGTFYGDLFLSGDLDPIVGTAPHFYDENLSNTATSWQYSVHLANNNPALTASPTSGVNDGAQIGSTTANVYAIPSNASIQQSYGTGGTGDTADGGIRQGQPASYVGTTAITTGSMAVLSTLGDNASDAEGLYILRFTIDNLALLTSLGNDSIGYNFALSWAMTCANDVLRGFAGFSVPPGGQGEVPLPAAFPLFAAAIGGFGAFGLLRKRRAV
jgi:hypothetical protein